uniref:PNPLA domain-containing protein n=1 Tax=Chromera velia CCMP2878 TaxID=1169474 RepID=A0A0G4GFE2_9ALVE|eukprot:Cvel_4636.t1-p1 / transcript=Cvel_4636.t1 / gene=Cvel_4636 / organism=Chromera_velia_CCMP2878 / gene_product=Calcium-independent phospholipase A2-gamma, putative / transcript_product=Calcium-independent phospholipase A2-gamma, putative / location=Cvel_scaffold204:104299-111563(+) / protein_length=989 / sequence_SO=supercontig / SO=protein_coding / is_pseudo=false
MSTPEPKLLFPAPSPSKGKPSTAKAAKGDGNPPASGEREKEKESAGMTEGKTGVPPTANSPPFSATVPSSSATALVARNPGGAPPLSSAASAATGKGGLRWSQYPSPTDPDSDHPNDAILFCGSIKAVEHEIAITRTGYFALTLSNQTDPVWNSFYLYMTNIRFVLEFTIKLDSSSSTGDPVASSERDRETEGGGEGGGTEEEREREKDERRSDRGPLSPGSPPLPSVTPPAGGTKSKQKRRYGGGRPWGAVGGSSESREKEAGSEGTAVCSRRGSISATAKTSTMTYFFAKEGSIVRLNGYSSMTLGFPLECACSISFAGAPEVRPVRPLSPFRHRASVLALDGGGVLGISALKILERIEQEVRRQAGHEVNLLDCFDFVCGTSTGGIIVLALLGGLTVKELISEWPVMTRRIFDGQRTLVSGLFFEGYDLKGLKDTLQMHIGSSFLDTCKEDETPYCFVTATDVKHSPYEPFLIRNYRHSFTGGHNFRGTSHFPMWAAAWATASAPTYLKGMRSEDLEELGISVQPQVHLVDGALTANNPARIALEECARLCNKDPIKFVNEDLETLVSIGTGQSFTRLTQQEGTWAPRAPSTLQIVLNATQLITTARNVHRDLLRDTAEHDNTYFRFNVPGIGDIAIDSVQEKDIDIITRATDEYLTDEKFFEVRKLARKLCFSLQMRGRYALGSGGTTGASTAGASSSSSSSAVPSNREKDRERERRMWTFQPQQHQSQNENQTEGGDRGGRAPREKESESHTQHRSAPPQPRLAALRISAAPISAATAAAVSRGSPEMLAAAENFLSSGRGAGEQEQTVVREGEETGGASGAAAASSIEKPKEEVEEGKEAGSAEGKGGGEEAVRGTEGERLESLALRSQTEEMEYEGPQGISIEEGPRQTIPPSPVPVTPSEKEASGFRTSFSPSRFDAPSPSPDQQNATAASPSSEDKGGGGDTVKDAPCPDGAVPEGGGVTASNSATEEADSAGGAKNTEE